MGKNDIFSFEVTEPQKSGFMYNLKRQRTLEVGLSASTHKWLYNLILFLKFQKVSFLKEQVRSFLNVRLDAKLFSKRGESDIS